MWWSRDSSGLVSFYDERESVWKPWDPEATEVSPPMEWAQGQPVAYPSAPPQYGGGYPQQPVYVVQNTTNGMAIASMILGILWLWWLGSILALIFGYVGKRARSTDPEGNNPVGEWRSPGSCLDGSGSEHSFCSSAFWRPAPSLVCEHAAWRDKTSSFRSSLGRRTPRDVRQ
jgi:hypothetical protein